MTRGPLVRNQSLDAANGTAAFAFIFATISGWTIQEWAAFAALVYSLILITEKVWRLIKNARSKPNE